MIPKTKNRTLFSLALSVGAPVHTSLDNLVLALKLVFVLVLEIAHFLVVNVHLFRPIAALEGSTVMPDFRRAFCHDWNYTYINVMCKNMISEDGNGRQEFW